MKSLRARLTAAVMMPLLALAVTFGGITCWMIHRTLSTTSDRILVGSVTMISRAINTDGDLHRQLLPLAVHLLQSRTTPVSHYSVYDGTRLLAGTAWLVPPDDYGRQPASQLPLHAPASFPKSYRDTMLVRGYVDAQDAEGVIQPAYLRDAVLEGRPVRIATEIRVLHRSARPVVIQVADFLDDRQAYEQIYFLRVLGAGILVAMIAVLLFYGAITWGLRPFAALTAQIDNTRRHPVSHVRLTLADDVPREAGLLVNAFNDLMERTERATDSLRQFTANASHQLRTPLAIVRVNVDVLGRHGPSSPQGATALADIAAAVDSLERLLTQLIALARMDEQGQEMTRLNPFDLTDIAANAVSNRVTHADAANMDIGFETDGCPVVALGDEMLAAEMISNLLDNAIRYNRSDGTVTVRTLVRDGVPIVEVEDDGPGIAPADREKVWERFYRAPGADAPQGSGLGLPIVRALGMRMGARVTLTEGENGKGVKAIIVFRPVESQTDSLPDTYFPPVAKMTAY
ncbi:sensor histidine kinase [Novosphingobium mangrovi (ex Huang et al. 2023)]|uniref:histidine kinase n=1 Tax=Novosphingobium mangrovi (ex Huang et al. 2023) TaxID=2976432 RepID=A0ABT2I9L8_9SPHN|nr:sensor histidine kinase [Novosphingobium mangrovi (ex Huang et al. 2023)]MCT2401515.1 sensor histidine kinase [Novosphingobium mangrovi (ex Huang et al. 2023)]